jgi:hypothetical protein
MICSSDSFPSRHLAAHQVLRFDGSDRQHILSVHSWLPYTDSNLVAAGFCFLGADLFLPVESPICDFGHLAFRKPVARLLCFEELRP